MRKLTIIACMLGACMATQVQATYQLKMLNDSAPAYTAQEIGNTPLVTETFGVFPTFCLETGEFFYLDHTYYFFITQEADQGGVVGITGNDKISMGTAYLYSLFRNNGFSGTVNESQLQSAIHWLEGELTSSQPQRDDIGLQNNPYLDMLTAGTSPVRNNWFRESLGAYGVVVLNLYQNENGTGLVQDQLGLVPVPEPGTWIAGFFLTVPFALNGYRMLRRKNA